MTDTEKVLRDKVARHPYPLIFATISGAHLYGFPSPDSDFDVRGCHVLPVREVVGLDSGPETIESSTIEDGLEIDLVSHDAAKFFEMMLKKNGYVLEQLFSPLVVETTPEHDELKSIGLACITKFHSYHYLGFAETQWRLFEKEEPRRVKPLLYIYRVLLTGIHLMKTGEVEANLIRLNDEAKLSQIDDLIVRKLAGPEKSTIENSNIDFHRNEYERLRAELDQAHRFSHLQEAPTARPHLNDLLIRLRLRDFANSFD